MKFFLHIFESRTETWISRAKLWNVHRCSSKLVQITQSESFQPESLYHVRQNVKPAILEVFANGRQCMTPRIYPSRAGSQQIKLSCKAGRVTVKSLRTMGLAGANAF